MNGTISPNGASRRGIRLLVLATIAAATLLGGCRLAAAEPSPTPADFPGITRVLGVAGIDIQEIVSGDPGCPDQALAPNAISFTATGLDQATPIPLHLYRFKDPTKAEAALGEIAACAKSYTTDPATYVNIVAGPYVLVGDGTWGPSFTQALTDGLKRAAATGG